MPPFKKPKHHPTLSFDVIHREIVPHLAGHDRYVLMLTCKWFQENYEFVHETDLFILSETPRWKVYGRLYIHPTIRFPLAEKCRLKCQLLMKEMYLKHKKNPWENLKLSVHFQKRLIHMKSLETIKT